MVRIKLYVVTYDNDQILIDNALSSLAESVIPPSLGVSLECTVINNFGRLCLPERFSNISVVDNLLRPDRSTGHLARNWNQSIMLGFGDLRNPECDILVHVQNDARLVPNWIENLLRHHSRHDFFQYGRGDEFCSYTVDAVRNIGLWDERFCYITHQESDYLLRAALHGKGRVSINDSNGVHHRLFQPVPAEEGLLDLSVPCGAQRKDGINHRNPSFAYGITENLFHRKYRLIMDDAHVYLRPRYWGTTLLKNLDRVVLGDHQPMLYPHFEKDVLSPYASPYLQA